MNENDTSATEKGPFERCAELAAWHQLEADPIQQERIAAELARCVIEAAKVEADRRAEQEAKEKAEKKAEADKLAKAEKKEQAAQDKEEAAAKIKAAELAEHAAWEKDMQARQERDREQRGAPDVIRERTIEVPENIRNNPMYQQILEQQRATQAQLVCEQAARFTAEQQAINYQGLRNEARMEAYAAQEKAQELQQQFEERQDPATPGIEGERDPYAQAANELDAKTLQEGQEIEGEVIDVAVSGGQNYYVIEQDGERFAVPAGDTPAHERGDEITASHTNEGIETGATYDYGR